MEELRKLNIGEDRCVQLDRGETYENEGIRIHALWADHGTMAPDAIVFAMANPNPEIMPDAAKAAGVRVIGTGRSDFPNQVNNVLAFPGIFKGALSVRARDINPQMKMAAAKAIAGLIPEDELNEENILPKAFDPRVAPAVADAVAQAARESGVARV